MQNNHKISPNPGKKLIIEVEGNKYIRYPIKTALFKKGDDYVKKITEIIVSIMPKIIKNHGKLFSNSAHDWQVVISEKIIAISQGRSFFIKDINPSWWAKTMSKYVTKSPYGIGLGSPWTMHMAINQVGLLRILFAAFISLLTKPFGIKGVFYLVGGKEIAAIDGPTSYSLFPSNVSAKLGPKDPQKVAKKIKYEIEQSLLKGINKLNKKEKDMYNKNLRFTGVVIIDSNDLGRNVLGNSTNKPNSFFEAVMKDNPMGQGRESTPLVVLI